MLHKAIQFITEFFVALLSMDLAKLQGKRRRILYFLQILSHALVQFQKDLGLQMAAALAYTSVLSLVPVLALSVLYTKVAGKLDNYSGSIQTWILKTFVADSAQGVIDYLQSFIDNMHTKTLGTIGVGGLLLTTYTLFKTVEKAFNYIWNVRRNRSLWATLQIISTLLVMVPALLAASFYLSGKSTLLHETVAWGSMFLPFALTMLSLTFVYKLVPNTQVVWPAAITGALISALVFELSKYGFNIYVSEVLPVSKIYGSLGLVPVFLIWIYLSWSIVLFGAELSYTMQNLSTLREERRQAQNRHEVQGLHEEWGFEVLRTLARLHVEGQGAVSSAAIGKALGLEGQKVRIYLDFFERQGWVIETHEGSDAYVFLRPMQTLTRHDVNAAIRSELGLPTERPPLEGADLIYGAEAPHSRG